jgi:hypothetical protein
MRSYDTITGQQKTMHLDLPQPTDRRSEWSPPASVAKLSRLERIDAERKLKRKIDTRILPALVGMYILSNFILCPLILDYLDRNSISSTRLGGITEDIPLAGNQFQLAVSILFVGYGFSFY